MLYVGILIIIATVYFLVKQYETRAVLFIAGLLMALLAGNPLAAFDAFIKSMTNGGLIQSILSVMGFAMVMKATKCNEHLVYALAKVLKKAGPLLIPASLLATFAVTIALPSASGASAAVGAIFIPLLINAGVHPVAAAASVFGGSFGSVLNPGVPHNPFIAKIAGISAVDVVQVHAPADIATAFVSAVVLFIVIKILHEDKGYEGALKSSVEIPKVNYLHALMPLIPLIIILLAATGWLPMLKKVGIVHAMLIGCILGALATRSTPATISKAFFEGMGSAYGNIMGIIIAAGVFVSGMQAIGVVSAFTKALVSSTGIAKYAASFGPFLFAVISGSGDAATFAFNEAVTPHAAEFGLKAANMGSMALLGGSLGRTMSPIAGAVIICAAIANVSPFEVAKRTAPGMIIAVIVAMFILL